MKAVIMAGGKGTRLLPLTANMPKTMIRLFDKPVMEHIIDVLKENDISQIIVTLKYNDKHIREFFGDGRDFGVNIEYVTEHEPLGSAGGVASCESLLDDDFLVISGDVLCDFELSEMLEFHKEKNSSVTVLMTRTDAPTEYGIMLTDEGGRVTKFIEKPLWSQVFSDTVNAGIYIIKPEVLNAVPKNRSFDFARDLLPRLVASAANVYGYLTSAAWHDIGDIKGVFQCINDVFDGRLHLKLPATEHEPCVYSASDVPKDVNVIAPVYIGKRVKIGKGACVGPYSVIGEDSIVGENSEIRNSLVCGARIGYKSNLNGAILAKGVVLEKNAVLKPGCVLGENAYCESDVMVDNDTRIWNDVRITKGDFVRNSILAGKGVKSFSFNEDGAISGVVNADITPELCVFLGLAIATNGMRIGVGGNSTPPCEMLKSALISGLCSAGAQVTIIDVDFVSAAAHVAKSYLFGMTIFVEATRDIVRIRFLNKLGMPIERDAQRRIESKLLTGETMRADTERIIKAKTVSGAGEAYAASLIREGVLRGYSVAIEGEGAANEALRNVFIASGCRIVPTGSGSITISVFEDGTALMLLDENGAIIEQYQIPTLIALAFFMSGEKELEVSGGAPNAVEHIAAEYGGRVLRIGRDGAAAEEKFAKRALMCDGIASALFLCEFLFNNKLRLSELRTRLPEFFIKSSEVVLNHERGRVMRVVADSCRHMHVETGNGLRVCTDGGWVLISPSRARRAIKITGEGMSEEIAEELCSMFCERTRDIDDSM